MGHVTSITFQTVRSMISPALLGLDLCHKRIDGVWLINLLSEKAIQRPIKTRMRNTFSSITEDKSGFSSFYAGQINWLRGAAIDETHRKRVKLSEMIHIVSEMVKAIRTVLLLLLLCPFEDEIDDDGMSRWSSLSLLVVSFARFVYFMRHAVWWRSCCSIRAR